MMLETKFTSFPMFDLGIVALKKITPKHAPYFFSLRANDDVMLYLDRPKLQNVHQAQAMIAKMNNSFKANNSINWGIFDKVNHNMIGTIGFWRIDRANYRAEIGYMLLPQYQGKGIMRKCLQQVLHYGFETMNLHSVVADINPQNLRSAKLLLAAGFQKEAYFRQNYFFNGFFLDSEIYCILKKQVM